METWKCNPSWGKKESEKEDDNVPWRKGMLFFKESSKEDEEKIIQKAAID